MGLIRFLNRPNCLDRVPTIPPARGSVRPRPPISSPPIPLTTHRPVYSRRPCSDHPALACPPPHPPPQPPPPPPHPHLTTTTAAAAAAAAASRRSISRRAFVNLLILAFPPLWRARTPRSTVNPPTGEKTPPRVIAATIDPRYRDTWSTPVSSRKHCWKVSSAKLHANVEWKIEFKAAAFNSRHLTTRRMRL